MDEIKGHVVEALSEKLYMRGVSAGAAHIARSANPAP